MKSLVFLSFIVSLCVGLPMDENHSHSNNWSFGHHADSPAFLSHNYDLPDSVRSPELDTDSLNSLWNTQPNAPNMYNSAVTGRGVGDSSYHDMNYQLYPTQGALYDHNVLGNQGQVSPSSSHLQYYPHSGLMQHGQVSPSSSHLQYYPHSGLMQHGQTSPGTSFVQQEYPRQQVHYSQPGMRVHNQMEPGTFHLNPVQIPDEDASSIHRETLEIPKHVPEEEYYAIYNDWQWQRKLPNDVNKEILLTASSKWPPVTQPKLLEAIDKVGCLLSRRSPLIQEILDHKTSALAEVDDFAKPQPPQEWETGELFTVNQYIQWLESPSNRKARGKSVKKEKRPKWAPKSVKTPDAVEFRNRMLRVLPITSVVLGEKMREFNEDERQRFIARILKGNDNKIRETANKLFSFGEDLKEIDSTDPDDQEGHLPQDLIPQYNEQVDHTNTGH